ncbi:sulfotransferase [Mesorhizobium sp. M0772]|uniref:sulfotransferase family protein n=1 Tax=Mesorhizobium sp. M0772 TaxID=2956998 RepID=UPI0033384FCE
MDGAGVAGVGGKGGAQAGEGQGKAGIECMNKHPSPDQLHDATSDAQEIDHPTPKKRAKAAKPAKRICIMVLGMHRSGTSALTRVISLLGAALPHRVINPDDSNASGYWEPTSLNAIDEKMLAEAGSSWDDWRPFDERKLSDERKKFYRAEIARIIGEEYGSAPVFIIKEPRIVRFADIYAGILKSLHIDVRYVLVFRNPLAVAASLEKRDGSNQEFGTLLWLRHVLDAEQASRRDRRALVSYEALVDDWRPCLQEIGKALSLNWPRSFDEAGSDIDAFISSASQHHQASLDELDASTTVGGWVKDSYAALRSLESDPNSPQPRKILDRVRQAFDTVSTTFGDAVYPARYALNAALAAAENDMQNVKAQSAAEIAASGQALEQHKLESQSREDSMRKQLTNERAAASKHRKTEKHLRALLEQERAASVSASVSAQAVVQHERQQLEIALACSQDKVAEKENEIIEIKEYLLMATKEVEKKQKDISDIYIELEKIHKSFFWNLYTLPSRIWSYLRVRIKNYN